MGAETSVSLLWGASSGTRGLKTLKMALPAAFKQQSMCGAGDELWELDECIMHKGHGVNRQLMNTRTIICPSDCDRVGPKEPSLH